MARTVEAAIQEETMRYIEACRAHNMRLAHIRYHAIRKLRHLIYGRV